MSKQPQKKQKIESDIAIESKKEIKKETEIFPPTGYDHIYITSTQNGALDVFMLADGQSQEVLVLLKEYSTLSMEEQANSSSIFTIMAEGLDKESTLHSYFPDYYYRKSNEMREDNPLPIITKRILDLVDRGSWKHISESEPFRSTRPVFVTYYHSWC
jgi:hypothetical protein